MSPYESWTLQSIYGCGYVSAATGIPLKGLWPKDKSMLQKVLLEASLAVDKSMPQHVHPEA